MKGRNFMNLKKFFAVFFVLVFTVTAALPVMSASAVSEKDWAGYSYSQQAFYAKPCIFEIAWNISDKTAESYGNKKIALSDKISMNVWYENGLKNNMSDKDVTAALADALNRIKSENPNLKKPIVINIENVGDASAEELTKQYYEDENIMYYAAVLPFADGKTKQTYLKKAYNDDDVAFFSVSLEIVNNSGTAKRYLDKAYKDDNIAPFSKCLDKLEDILNDRDFSAVVNTYAEKAYKDDRIDFFSVLVDEMYSDTAEAWFDRAKKDKEIAFASIFDDYWDEFDDAWENFDDDWDWDYWDKFDDAWEKIDDSWDDFDDKRNNYENYVNSSDYVKYGVTYKDGHYYYNGEPVRYFLDVQRSDSSAKIATVETNPNGKASIKIVRDKNGNITGVKKLTEKEIKKYFGNTED